MTAEEKAFWQAFAREWNPEAERLQEEEQNDIGDSEDFGYVSLIREGSLLWQDDEDDDLE